MAQPTWAVVEAAVQLAIATASGVSAVWSHQNVNAPAQPYVRLSLGTITTPGIDGIVESTLPAWTALTPYDATDRVLNGGRTYVCTTSGASASSGGPTGTGTGIVDGSCRWSFVVQGSEIAQTVLGVREVALQLEAFSGPPPSTSDPAAGLVEARGETARALMDRTVTLLRLPTARGTLAAVGVTPFDPGPVNWIPDVASTGFRGRASCDVRCRMPARALVEYAAYIASVTSTATIQGGADGSTLSETIAAP